MKNNTVSEKELFETIPVPRAVATLAVPTVISQIVTMIYNLADTFFVGQIGKPLLNLLGASPDTYGYAQSYLVVIIYLRLGEKTAVSLHPKYFTFRFVRQIFSVGLASALATALGNASNMVIVRLASGYGDIPVAAYGIVKRIDQFPLNVSMGLCQGFMPLVGYNYAAKNYKRMRAGTTATWDQVNKYFALMQMPIISSRYWNIVHGENPEEVRRDREGMQTMRILGRNMAFFLYCKDIGMKMGLQFPRQEETTFTNFIPKTAI